MSLAPADVEAMERATVAAVAPDAVEEIAGLLVAMDSGTVGRAHATAPLSHDLTVDAATLERIETLYADRGLSPAFRIADAAGMDGLRAALSARGYTPRQPTLVQVAAPAGLRAVSRAAPAELAERPDEDWSAVFVGPGFDPVDGASRVRILRRSPDAAFASVRDQGEVVAVGAAAFGHGWSSIHGMRTALARRGEGLAGRVLSALGAATDARGVGRIFLQVEETNAPARALYARAGFQTAWRYWYWRRGS